MIDTNILLRISRRGDADHDIVDAAPGRLAVAGAVLYYAHQNIAELWNVATRAAERNDFGLTVADVYQEVRAIELFLGLRFTTQRWPQAMKVHGVTYLLTLNPDDFKRYPHVVAVHPRTLAYAGRWAWPSGLAPVVA